MKRASAALILVLLIALAFWWLRGLSLVDRSAAQGASSRTMSSQIFGAFARQSDPKETERSTEPPPSAGKMTNLGESRDTGNKAGDVGMDLAKADPLAYKKAPPLTQKEIASIRTLLRTFFEAGRGKASLNLFLQQLQEAGLEPQLSKDSNPYTGDMLVIRTAEALEGTRYLHAQYFQDESRHKDPFRQHLSFEIRPSPDSMELIRGMVQELSGAKMGAPKSFRSDQWIEWQVGNHSLWAQRLGKEDLANDPYNARSPEDIGSLRVAIELIPEHHDE